VTTEDVFLDTVLANEVVAAVLARMPTLGLSDWYLTAGGLFQTVWNVLDGRPPERGIRDYDVFYFDPDTSWEAEDAVIQRAAALFEDVPAEVEVRNEARVHLWYEQKFGRACEPFRSAADAIDHFAATACCVGVRTGPTGGYEVYASFGFRDLFDFVLRPNPVLAPRSVYEAKAERWSALWPRLTVLPWPDNQPDGA
jgi:hypothetical protein